MTPPDAETIARPRFAAAPAAQARAYQTVARAITFLEENAADQPHLDDVATHVGLSGPHLQRVFSDWAGISPKRFLQALTLDRAGHALATQDVLGATLEAGLSSPGRLHDLVVSCEAVTPGEWKRGGAGMEVRWGVAPTPFGDTLMGETTRGLCHLVFIEGSESTALEDLRVAWPKARLTHDGAGAAALVPRIFGDCDVRRPLHLLVKGTNFQVQVWRALLRIPPGTTTSYGAVAQSLGRPTAARAVAGAVARNHIAVLIPCHRVLRGDGGLGGYRWATHRKRALLALEQISSG